MVLAGFYESQGEQLPRPVVYRPEQLPADTSAVSPVSSPWPRGTGGDIGSEIVQKDPEQPR